ncbi:hypothetical protein ABG862_07250 [Bacteroides xylanisolvens]|uniref:hypothetical protein n=1 Tax=Bacteroides TaxID=816 RepID=UPI00290E5128|nr:hypothetical protein [Bacteroides sp.]MDU7613494.1 hypothetical protein [Bacteroides sp.]
MVGQRGRTRRNSIGDGLVAVVDGYGREPGRLDDRTDGEAGKARIPERDFDGGSDGYGGEDLPVRIRGEDIFSKRLADGIAVFLYVDCRLATGNQCLCHICSLRKV